MRGRAEDVRDRGPIGLTCPGCGSGLEPLDRAEAEGRARLVCRGCGSTFRARRRTPCEGPEADPNASRVEEEEPTPVGSMGLVLRGWGLLGLEWAYRGGTAAGAVGLLAAGGFATVLGAWLRDEVVGWRGVVEALGGVRVEPESRDPDADFGPAIVYADAPPLFRAIGQVAHCLGARPPAQVRLTYLPCCGVVAWRRTNALVLGLPLLHVLSMAELRAVLAHELAHLARGDATRSARSARFVQALGRALDDAGPSRSPLRLWARSCRGVADALLAPIARGQEARADRCAAALAGGGAAAGALVKVALVQSLFREVLHHYDPTDLDAPNLYASFRAFWGRMPDSLKTALRHDLLSGRGARPDGVHPPLLDRLAVVQSYPHRPESDPSPARMALGDLEALEQMLHNRLFATRGIEPSVFHRAGT